MAIMQTLPNRFVAGMTYIIQELICGCDIVDPNCGDFKPNLVTVLVPNKGNPDVLRIFAIWI